MHGVNRIKHLSKAVGRENMRLSSGNQITQAADDPAGLAIAETMRSKIRSYKMAGHNAMNGVSMLQVAEGTLNEMSSNVIRLRELAMQASNSTWNEGDRKLMALEFESVKNEIQRQARSSEFNSTKLLSGSDKNIDIQVGLHNHEMNDRISYRMKKIIQNVSNPTLAGANVDSEVGARNSLKKIDDYLQSISEGRSIIGATMRRLESVGKGISIAHENHSAGRSQITDTDYALSVAKRASENIKLDTTVAVTAQANDFTKSALRLL